ncbi:hypothetical protein BDV25DRAFT_65201 [Aspergillus avenaceus]|uniref:Uncharacterized protein n=1 Tax=Aspergillus avenaceus TaxID=36643 RepID=A0A5N6U1E2_ASPAV|nr:hypothetical protein BDV25DRAFT_65201 [Aspergillus avenaceus]
MAAGAFRGVISFFIFFGCFYILDVLCMCWGFWSSTIYVLLLRPCVILTFVSNTTQGLAYLLDRIQKSHTKNINIIL